MTKPKKLEDLPNGSVPYYLLFRKVGEYMICESFQAKSDLEKALFDLKYNNEEFRVVKANNIFVKFNVELNLNENITSTAIR